MVTNGSAILNVNKDFSDRKTYDNWIDTLPQVWSMILFTYDSVIPNVNKQKRMTIDISLRAFYMRPQVVYDIF